MWPPRMRFTIRSVMVVVAVVAIISWACITLWRALPYMITWDDLTVSPWPPENLGSPSAPDRASPTPRYIRRR
jgi:hypothetical protein